MKPNKHDDMCPCTRFRAQDEFCRCGAVDRQQIVADVSEAFGKRLRKITGSPALTAPVRAAEVKAVGWETEAEWELEQRAFNWNSEWSEEDTRTLINDLWRQYCLAAEPSSLTAKEG